VSVLEVISWRRLSSFKEKRQKEKKAHASSLKAKKCQGSDRDRRSQVREYTSCHHCHGSSRQPRPELTNFPLVGVAPSSVNHTPEE
jgi:hypothetical protein